MGKGVGGLAVLAGLMLGAAAVIGPRSIAPAASAAGKKSPRWKELLTRRLPEYGHRNWIVIADSAYPSQTQAGIETVVTGADQLEVVGAVLDALAGSRHVRPVVYLDAELSHVPEGDAPGIGRYREDLKKLLRGRTVQYLPHEEIIDKLDQAGQKFHVLVLKTTLTLPYTSVFLDLDCGYWTPEAERRLRARLSPR